MCGRSWILRFSDTDSSVVSPKALSVQLLVVHSAMRGAVVGMEGAGVEEKVEGNGSLNVCDGDGWCGFHVAPHSLPL